MLQITLLSDFKVSKFSECLTQRRKGSQKRSI